MEINPLEYGSVESPTRFPCGWLCYGEPDAVGNAIGYAKHYSRSRQGVIRVCGEAGNLIETHEHGGDVTLSSDGWSPC